MPRAGKQKAQPEGAAEQPEAQRPRAEDLPLEFDVDGTIIKSLSADPWNVSRRGVVIKPFTSWWDPNDHSKDRSANDCAIVGYLEDYTYPDGKTEAGYVLENGGFYYVMQPNNVWSLLLVKDCRRLPATTRTWRVMASTMSSRTPAQHGKAAVGAADRQRPALACCLQMLRGWATSGPRRSPP